MKEQDLKAYGALRKDPRIYQQLVQLYHSADGPDGFYG